MSFTKFYFHLFIFFWIFGLVLESLAHSRILEANFKVAKKSFSVKKNDAEFSMRGLEYFEKIPISKCNKQIVDRFWMSYFNAPPKAKLFSMPPSSKRLSPHDIEVASSTRRWFLSYNSKNGQALRNHQGLVNQLKFETQLACNNEGQKK